MSLFDELKGEVGAILGGGQSPMLAALAKVLVDPQSGGLQGLVNQFKQQGLGDVIDSWVRGGQNLPISAEQVRQALGDQRLQQFASAAGIDVQSVSAKLTELLPQVVDKLTPEGKIPSSDLLEKGLSFLSSLQKQS